MNGCKKVGSHQRPECEQMTEGGGRSEAAGDCVATDTAIDRTTGRETVKIARRALIGIALVLVVAIAALQYDRRHVVTPKSFGTGTRTVKLAPVEVTLHKYHDYNSSGPWYVPPERWRWETTGKSVTFAIPKAYLYLTNNLSGGPQHSISLGFDSETLEPHTIVARRLEGSLPRATIKDRLINLRVSHFDPPVQNSHFVRHWRTCFAGTSTCRGMRFEPKGQFCGLEMYDDGVWRMSRAVRESAPEPVRTAKFYWSDPVPDRGGEPVLIRCTASSLMRCRAHTSFGEWQMQVSIPSSRLCAWHALIAQSRTLLEQHVVGRTDARS